MRNGRHLNRVLELAVKQARAQKHRLIVIEHLAFALTYDPYVEAALAYIGADKKRLIDSLHQYLMQTTELKQPEKSKKEAVEEEEDAWAESIPHLSHGADTVCKSALLLAKQMGHAEANGIHLMTAILQEGQAHAAHFMSTAGVTRKALITALENLNVIEDAMPRTTGTAMTVSENAAGSVTTEKDYHQGNETLSKFTHNLNLAAHMGDIDPLIGRTAEIERTVQILGRRKKNNPILVGEPGVGKTAVAEGLAWMIEQGTVPEALKDAAIFSLDLGAMLAGTKYRGDFEKRLKGVMEELQKIDNAILFIDEIHTLIGAGAAGGSAMDASNILKPALAKGELRCIGATTYGEYRKVFEKDAALNRRFQQVEIGEPNLEEAYEIVKGLAEKYGSHHGVTYTDDALRAAVTLSNKYIHDHQLPDKAIDIIDEVGSRFKMGLETRAPNDSGMIVIDSADIKPIVARMARIPENDVGKNEKENLRTLGDDLKRTVFGQDDAIDTLKTAIWRARSGQQSPNRPVGNFLFAGPTGVGKTEVTRQLAKNLGIELIRFDMSEYMERHTVSRLIGAPPGYVGYDQGGLLAEAVNKHPYCVLLLDEIEKAHPDIFNVLLQVMDNGKITDGQGRPVYFENAIIVMTTNAGSSHRSKPIGFSHSGDEVTFQSDEAIKRLFSPEFRNRLDATVHFQALDTKTIGHVVEKFLDELRVLWAAKGIEAEISDSAKHYLAEHGYDVEMGARPMGRLIDHEIKNPVAPEILFGALQNGGCVKIDFNAAVNDGDKAAKPGLIFAFTAKASNDNVAIAPAIKQLPAPEKTLG